MNDEPKTPSQLDAAEVVVGETNALTIQDQDKAVMIATIRPIAERLPMYAKMIGTCKVRNAAEAAQANRLMASMKDDSKAVVDALQAPIDRLFALHRKWTAFRGMFTDVLDAGAKTVRQQVVSWQEDERRKAREAEAKLQAEADAKARKEREKLEAQAQKAKTPEKAEELRAAAASVIAPTVTVEANDVVGTRKKWIVSKIDAKTFLAAAAQDQNLWGFVEIKETALVRSKAANKMLTVPGITFDQIVT